MFATTSRTLLVACVLAVFVATAGASPIVIDNFNDPSAAPGYPHHVAVTGIDDQDSSIVGLNPLDTVFGYRSLWVYAQDNPGGSFGSADATVAGGRLGTGTNTIIAPYTARWSASWKDPVAGAAIDLIDDDGAPNSGFFVDFLQAEYDCRIVIYLRGPGTTLAPKAWTPELTVPADPNPQTVFVPFSQLTFLENTTAFDFTDVRFISLRVYGEEDGDYELDAFHTGVPEPAALAILAAGAVAILRRRKKA